MWSLLNEQAGSADSEGTNLQHSFGDTARISVIIPHFNDLAGLALCIEALRRQTWPRDRMEVIIADNNSSCGLDIVKRVAEGYHVVLAPVQGAGPARNAGVAACNGNILAFIDSDCVPSSEWLVEGVRALQHHDFVGGEVRVTAKDSRFPTPVEAWEIVFGFNFKRYILVEGYTGSGNMFVTRKVFDHVGGFLNGLSEDMEWSFRARQLGYRLGYAPCAVVAHPARREWHELLGRWRRVIREHYLLACTERLGRAKWVLRIVAMPLSAIPHIGLIVESDRLPTVAAKVSAMAILLRHRFWRAGFMARVAFAAPGVGGLKSLNPARQRVQPAGTLGTEISFLGLNFRTANLEQAAADVGMASLLPYWSYIVTPNAAHLARLRRRDSDLRNIYRKASMCFLDSRVVYNVARLCGLRPPVALPGVELVSSLFGSVVSDETSICIVGGDPVVVERLMTRYRLRKVSHVNPSLGFWRDPDEMDRIAEFVALSCARLTFLVVGSPQQEILADHIDRRGGACGVGLCVGASLEFLTGHKRRAPRWLQMLSLEWAYRLWREPRRMVRRYFIDSPLGLSLVFREAIWRE
jgi:exopolysaccharide biosynthesis WecB/TagA/CpsF family protein